MSRPKERYRYVFILMFFPLLCCSVVAIDATAESGKLGILWTFFRARAGAGAGLSGVGRRTD